MIFDCDCTKPITWAIIGTFVSTVGVCILAYIIIRAVQERRGTPRLVTTTARDSHLLGRDSSIYQSRRARRVRDNGSQEFPDPSGRDGLPY